MARKQILFQFMNYVGAFNDSFSILYFLLYAAQCHSRANSLQFLCSLRSQDCTPLSNSGPTTG